MVQFKSILLLLCALLVSSVAKAEPLLLAQSYWVDPSGRVPFDDVTSQPFRPFTGTLAQGYQPSSLWIKLTLVGQVKPQRLGLLVRPAFLRVIELYDPANPAPLVGAPSLISGRDAPINDQNHIGIDSGFIISTSPEPRDLYIRVSSTTALIVEVKLDSLIVAEQNSRVTSAILALYFAFLLSFCLWGLISWGVRRDNIYGLFTLRQLYSISHIFVFYGLMRYFFSAYLDPSISDFVYTFITVTMIAVAAFFDQRLISEFNPNHKLLIFARILMMLPLVSLGLLFLGYTQKALFCNSLIVALIISVNAALAFSTRGEDGPYQKSSLLALRIGFSAMAIIVILPQLMFQNILSPSLFMLKLLFSHAVISTVTLFTILTIRARQRDYLAQMSLLSAEINAQELRQENERRMEKERFLSMLTHELRNPLGVIRLMANDKSSNGQVVQKAALDMVRIIERVEQSEQVEGQERVIQEFSIDLIQFLENEIIQHGARARLRIRSAIDHTVMTDPDILQSIIRNLLDNAEKYSLAETPIYISVQKEDWQGRAGISINIQNVIGHAGAPDPDKIFTKYYRSKGAHRQPGSGLGLFLVAGWSKAINAHIDFLVNPQADMPETISFRLWLPL